MESYLEGTHVSDVHRLEYTHVLRSVALAGPGVQRDAASKHRPDPLPSDTRQRTYVWGRLYERRLRERKRPTLKVGNRVRFNKKTSPVQKKVFARLDRRSLFWATRTTRAGAHLQDSRVGRHSRGKDLLPRGFPKSPRTGRCAFFRVEKVSHI